MRDFDRPGATLEREHRRGSRFADIGDRLARTFGTLDRPKPDPADWQSTGDYPGSDETVPLWDQEPPRFPVMRHGYDPAAVDEHIGELERELGELRASTQPTGTVTAEIERVGEQTSAILRVAYEQAREIKRRAQAEADACLADAAANAVAISQDAKRQLRDLDTETDTIWRERSRLIEDARTVATALFTLAEEAAERFPAEPEHFSSPQPQAAPAGPAPQVPAVPTPQGPAAAAPQGPAAAETAEGDVAEPQDTAPQAD